MEFDEEVYVTIYAKPNDGNELVRAGQSPGKDTEQEQRRPSLFKGEFLLFPLTTRRKRSKQSQRRVCVSRLCDQDTIKQAARMYGAQRRTRIL